MLKVGYLAMYSLVKNGRVIVLDICLSPVDCHIIVCSNANIVSIGKLGTSGTNRISYRWLSARL